MAKKKVGSCDGECQAYKNLKVEVHEPEDIFGTALEDYLDEDMERWEPSDEFIRWTKELEVRLEAMEKARDCYRKKYRFTLGAFVALFAMYVTVCSYVISFI